MKIHPTEKTVIIGENVEIACKINDPQWTYNDYTSLPSNSKMFSDRKNIYITNVDVSNIGYYECSGKNQYGEYLRARSYIRVLG